MSGWVSHMLCRFDARSCRPQRASFQVLQKTASLIHAAKMCIGCDQDPEDRVEIRVARQGASGPDKRLMVIAANHMHVSVTGAQPVRSRSSAWRGSSAPVGRNSRGRSSATSQSVAVRFASMVSSCPLAILFGGRSSPVSVSSRGPQGTGPGDWPFCPPKHLDAHAEGAFADERAEPPQGAAAG